MINIKSYILSAFGTNCYLVWKDGSPDAFIVDPGAPSAALQADVAPFHPQTTQWPEPSFLDI